MSQPLVVPSTAFPCTDYRQSYPDGTARGKAPVPKGLCKLIQGLFPKKSDCEFAFTLISHVLAGGGKALAPHTLLRNFPGAPKSNASLAALVRKLGPLLTASDYHFGGSSSHSRTFTLREDVQPILWKDPILYKTWSAFLNRRRWTDKVTPFDEQTFVGGAKGSQVILTPEFIAAMVALSQRSLLFDRQRALSNPLIWETPSFRSEALRLPQGAVHTHYTLQRSGRIGTKEFNLQGISKPLREYILPRAGCCHLYFDYKTQEPRILAYLSGDAVFQEALSKDIYKVLMEVLGTPSRNETKPIVNSIMYGSSAKPFAERLFYPEEKKPRVTPEQVAQAEYLIGALKHRFPRLYQWFDEKTMEIIAKGYSETPCGTVRTEFERRKDGKIRRDAARRSGISHISQGAGADIMRVLIVELRRLLAPYGAYLLLPVHDAVLVEAPIEHQSIVGTLVKETMEDIPRRLMPGLEIPVDDPTTWHKSSNNAVALVSSL